METNFAERFGFMIAMERSRTELQAETGAETDFSLRNNFRFLPEDEIDSDF